MKRTPSQEDKDKVQQGNADRGEVRANASRGAIGMRIAGVKIHTSLPE